MKPAALLAAAALVAATPPPTVYFIRHGEKPDDRSEHGLSDAGKRRAQCLRTVFGAGSNFTIGHIMVETPKKSGARRRPYDTVAPLADDLGLAIDTRCGKTDYACAIRAIEAYRGPGNILVCWEHKGLVEMAKALGGKEIKTWPGSEYDWIWADAYPYSMVDIMHEGCRVEVGTALWDEDGIDVAL